MSTCSSCELKFMTTCSICDTKFQWGEHNYCVECSRQFCTKCCRQFINNHVIGDSYVDTTTNYDLEDYPKPDIQLDTEQDQNIVSNYMKECYGVGYNDTDDETGSFINNCTLCVEQHGELCRAQRQFASETEDIAIRYEKANSSGTNWSEIEINHCWVHEPVEHLKRLVPKTYLSYWTTNSLDNCEYNGVVVKKPSCVWKQTHCLNFRACLDELVLTKMINI